MSSETQVHLNKNNMTIFKQNNIIDKLKNDPTHVNCLILVMSMNLYWDRDLSKYFVYGTVYTVINVIFISNFLINNTN